MADVTINGSTGPDPEFGGTNCGPFWKTDQIGYRFFVSSALKVQYAKTTDGGATWGAGVSVLDTGESTDGYVRFSCWCDQETTGDSGTKIHIAGEDSHGNRVRYRSLDISSDTLGTEVTVATVATFLQGGGYPDKNWLEAGMCPIVKARGGNLYIAFGDVTGGVRAWRLYRSTDGGATWGTRNAGWGLTTNSFDNQIQLLPASDIDSNDIAAITLQDNYPTATASLYLWLHDDSANSWGNQTTIDTLTSDGGDWADYVYWGDAILRHSDGKAICAYWSRSDYASPGSGGLKVAELVLTAAGIAVTAKTSVITGTSGGQDCSAFINQATGDLYVLYARGTWYSSTDVFYKKSTDGGATWGTETQFNATAHNIQHTDAGHSVKSGQAGRFCPSWADIDNLDIITNAANSVAITTGGSSFTASVSETVSVTEGVAVSRGTSGAVAETDTVSELLVAFYGARPAPTETVSGPTESITVTMATSAAAPETISLTESVAASRGTSVAPAETVTGPTDGVVVIYGGVAAPSETVTGPTESITVRDDANVALAETDSLTESVAASVATAGAVAETVSASEQVAASIGTSPAPAETVTGPSESLAVVYGAQVAPAETVTGPTDSITADASNGGVDIAETVSGPTESVAVTVATSAAAPETVSLAENLAAARGTSATPAETVTGPTDGVVVVYGAQVAPSEMVSGPTESITVRDDANVALPETVATSESVAASASVSSSVAETVTLTELVAASRGCAVALSETVVLSDALAVLYAALVALAETLATGEAVAANTSTAGAVGVSETVSVTEAVTVQAARSAALVETVAYSEQVSALAAASAAVTESLLVLEQVLASVATSASVVETVSGAEQVSVLRGNLAGLAENIGAIQEAISTHFVGSLNLAETIALLEQVQAFTHQLTGPVAVTMTEDGEISLALTEDGEISLALAEA